jgi:hypothetical protein
LHTTHSAIQNTSNYLRVFEISLIGCKYNSSTTFGSEESFLSFAAGEFGLKCELHPPLPWSCEKLHLMGVVSARVNDLNHDTVNCIKAAMRGVMEAKGFLRDGHCLLIAKFLDSYASCPLHRHFANGTPSRHTTSQPNSKGSVRQALDRDGLKHSEDAYAK